MRVKERAERRFLKVLLEYGLHTGLHNTMYSQLEKAWCEKLKGCKSRESWKS